MKNWIFPILATSAISVGATLAVVSLWGENSKRKTKPQKRAESYNEEIIDEQLARNIAFLGREGVDRIRKTSVAVVGAGGVGSWVATMLVRSGFGTVRVIDFDQVTLSSLNRHACATLEDVGTPKVFCVCNFLSKVAPWVKLEPIKALWNSSQAQLLDGADYVVDCIDNVDTKVELLAYCVKNNIPVIASMGASTKADPRRIEISDISNTDEDPLSRVCRIKLRHQGVRSGVITIFSSEKPGPEKAKLLDLDEKHIEEGNVDELGVLQGFRIRTLPVLGPLPAIFGLTIVTYLLTTVGGYDSIYDPILGGAPTGPRKHGKPFINMVRRLRTQLERNNWLIDNQNPWSTEDIAYLIEEVWKNKSLNGAASKYCLTVWDPSKPKDINNIVPVSPEQLKKHEELIFHGTPLSEVYTPEQLSTVAKRQKLNEWYQRWR